MIRDPALNERHYGDLQGLNKADVERRVGVNQVLRWRRSYAVTPPGGESLEATARRAIPFFERAIGGHLNQNKNVLAAFLGKLQEESATSLVGSRGDLQIHFGADLLRSNRHFGGYEKATAHVDFCGGRHMESFDFDVQAIDNERKVESRQLARAAQRMSPGVGWSLSPPTAGVRPNRLPLTEIEGMPQKDAAEMLGI